MQTPAEKQFRSGILNHRTVYMDGGKQNSYFD